MQQRTIIENPPQAFSPNSRPEKAINRQKGLEALAIAKKQNRKVVFLKQGECAFSRQREPKSIPETIRLESGQLYPTVKAAKIIGIKSNCLSQHKKDGRITAQKINGRLFYTAEEIERFKNSRKKK